MIVSSYIWHQNDPISKKQIDADDMFKRANNQNLKYYHYIDWIRTDIENQLTKSRQSLMPFVLSKDKKETADIDKDKFDEEAQAMTARTTLCSNLHTPSSSIKL